MTQNFDDLYSRNFDVCCELGNLGLSGLDELLRCQVGHARAVLAVGGEQLRNAQALSLRPDAMKSLLSLSLQETNASARKYLAELSTWQLDAVRLLEMQTRDACAILTGALAETFTAGREQPAARESASGRARKGEHQLAA